MDNNRFLQILQETINSQNSIISSLNSYVHEVYTSPNNGYDQYFVSSLQSEVSNANSRINDLTNTLAQLQNDNQNLAAQLSNQNSSSQSYELESLRNLVSSLTNDKDYVQSTLTSRDQQINDLNNTINGLNAQYSSSFEVVNALNSQISELNVKLSELHTIITQKQTEIDALISRESDIKSSLQSVKAKVALELGEALQDIDAAIDEVDG